MVWVRGCYRRGVASVNLYRIDTPSGPLCDLLGPRLVRRYDTARMHAREHVERYGEYAAITRISGGGALKTVCVSDSRRNR